MSSSSESGECAVILQLRRWCHFRPKLSDFHQVFISPTRKLLVLLSHQYEALLISLDKDRPCEGVWKPRTSQFSHQERADSCLVDSEENVAWSTVPVRTESSSGFPQDGSSLFEQTGIICDAKSLAWVHCGDTYGQHGGFVFREVLVVSGDHGITVHAFGHLSTVGQETDSLLKPEILHGKWVEWGPHHDEQTQNAFNSDSNHGNFCETNGVAGIERNQHVHHGIEFSESVAGSTTSIWFRTFLMEVDASEDEGDFVVRFPVKSSIPHSAEVVSFSIFDSILNFLEYRAHKEYHPCNENHACEDVSESSVSMSVCEDPTSYSQHKSSDTDSKSPTTEICEHDVVDSARNLYKCSRVFSSSSNHYIGLVLIPGDSASSKSITFPKTLVIILGVSHLGIQWVCSVDLPESCPNLYPALEWVDFQFLDNLLVCLSISGLVYVCDAKTGNLVSSVDVLRHCDVHLKFNSELGRRMYPVKGNSSTVMEKSAPEFQQIHDFNGKGAHSHVPTKRIFRRLLVTSFSQMLAVIDGCGVIYLINVDDYKLEKNGFCKFMHPFWHFGLGTLACWKVAAVEIGRQKAISEFLRNQSSKISACSDGSTAEVECRNKKRQYIQFKGGQSVSYPSVFSAHSQVENCQICHCKLPAIYTRKVFLPTYKFSMEDAVCFSPFGIMQLVRGSKNKSKIVHTCLHIATSAYDERVLNNDLHSRWFSSFNKEFVLGSEAIGCCFEGSLYLVTEEGLYVVLPSFSVSSNVMPREIGYWQSSMTGMYPTESTLESNGCRDILRPWQLEVLDRTLLYEGPSEADYLCSINGWDLKIARMRRLELALCYLKVDEIERSLEVLAEVNLAEEGTLKLLLASAYKIFCNVGSETEVATASRLLTLAACFATKMVRRYGLLALEKDRPTFGFDKGRDMSMQWTLAGGNNSRRLEEMALYLEIIRNLQQKLSIKRRKPSRGMVDYVDGLNLVETSALKDEPLLLDSASSVVVDASEAENLGEKTLPSSGGIADRADQLALSTIEHSLDISEIDLTIATTGVQGRKLIPRENSRDMIARWEVANFDLKTVVEDALRSGRLPLAVLQLHLHRLRDTITKEESHDSFGEVRDVGRAIAYDLFLKGESGLAIATLQKLGEDMEASLRQLLLGTTRNSIRTQVAEEMKRFGFLKSREWITLERLSLIERLYPSSSFWRTYLERWKQLNEVASASFQQEDTRLLLNLHMWINYSVECNEIDGVVNGSWTSISKASDFAMIDGDTARAGYWACAPIWSDSWDLTTIDRVIQQHPIYVPQVNPDFILDQRYLQQSLLKIVYSSAFCLCHESALLHSY